MRKFLLRTLMLTILLCTTFTVTAFAEDAVVTGSDVNFRSGPGMNYEIIGCLAKGETVTVNDRSNAQWYGVSYNGTTGFISSDYLKIQEENGSSSTGSGESGTINAMYVRFRSGPSSSSSNLGEYNTGTAVTITGADGDWTAVTINGQAGYVYSQYVTKSSGATTPDPTPTPEPTPEPTPDTTITIGETQSGYINGDHVHMRSGPSTSDSIRGIYERGQKLTITGKSGDWTAVIVDGYPGYIYSSYVASDTPSQPVTQPTEPEPATTPEPTTPVNAEDGYIKGNNVRFRAAASTTSSILGEYNYGTALTITGTSGDWTAVTIDGKAGYVYSQYVAKGSISVAAGSNSDLGTQIAQFALQYVGYPYVWAGKSPSTGFDCSGLVYYVYGEFGYTLPRVANDQAGSGTAVSADELQPGDILCFYSGSSYVGHVGIYIGDGKFVHASTSTTGVIISELSGYYTNRGYTARRIV